MNVVLGVILYKVEWSKWRALTCGSGSEVEWLAHWTNGNGRLPVQTWGLPELLSNWAWAVWFILSSIHPFESFYHLSIHLIHSIIYPSIWSFVRSSVFHSVKNSLHLLQVFMSKWKLKFFMQIILLRLTVTNSQILQIFHSFINNSFIHSIDRSLIHWLIRSVIHSINHSLQLQLQWLDTSLRSKFYAH